MMECTDLLEKDQETDSIEVLLTWNFAHLNNPFTRKRVRQLVEDEGFVCPEICSPEELLEADK